jgi:tetratricopeptide (TPR) repeat protein
MPSIIEGYSYDIFISYRQKDNKGDKWISQFVEALKTELEATFKEDVSVYFDENPHDRLQETHNVDKSLEGKLKCLILIPILSQTYCDPNSYAWQYEFLAFLKMAENDPFGKDVKLRSGNVASRILPIRIHDLEQEDIKLFEKETGGVLRAMDFVFKTSTGVNRPLKANEDHPQDNLNKTFYNDQINKVAHAIKEIILGMKTESVPEGKEKDQPRGSFKEVREDERKINLERPVKSGKWKLLFPVTVLSILIIAALFIYPKIFKKDTFEKLKSSGERISVAVMPFQNRTTEATMENSQGIIQDILNNHLSSSKELIVRKTEAIDYLIQNQNLTNNATITPDLARTISQKLDANVFIYGSINQVGDKILLSAQLIDSRTGEIFKPFQIEGSLKEDNIIDIANSLSVEINNFLLLSQLKQKKLPDFSQLETTNSPEAFNNYIAGMSAFGKGDFSTARGRFLEAIKIDSNFTFAIMMVARADLSLPNLKEGKEYCLRAYEKRDQMPLYMRISVDDLHAWYTEEGTPGRIKYLNQLLDLDDQDPMIYYNIGNNYRLLGQWDKVIPMLEKSLDIYKKWGVKPTWVYGYVHLGKAYHEKRQYKKEKVNYKKADRDFPNNNSIIYRQAILSLTEGDTIMANQFIRKYISNRKDNAISEANISTGLAGIYYEAGDLYKAEEYYHKALLSEPENPVRFNNLASFLINNDRDINEGMNLVDKALELDSNNYSFLNTKGWGLYKQRKYQEALEMLQKSWDLRMQNAIYNHEAFLHLEAAKKVVASQKNN